MFYQYNPLGETWGHMSWGHAVRSDMLHWDGETVITERVYPTQPLDRLELLAGARTASAPARLWELGSVWPQR